MGLPQMGLLKKGLTQMGLLQMIQKWVAMKTVVISGRKRKIKRETESSEEEP